jgi:hypothetical protein
MGMFDYLKSEYPLPDGLQPRFELKDKYFQTKSFKDPIMDIYIIKSDGKLYHEIRKFEDVPEKKRPYYGKPEWGKNPLFQIMGSIKAKKIKTVFCEDFTGIVEFYGEDKKNRWHDYKAVFFKGILQELTYVHDYWPNLFWVAEIPREAYEK